MHKTEAKARRVVPRFFYYARYLENTPGDVPKLCIMGLWGVFVILPLSDK